MPIRHQYVVSEPRPGSTAIGVHPDRARPGPHRLLPRRGRRRCSSAATCARPTSGGPPTARPPLAEPRHAVRARPGRLRRAVGGGPAAGCRPCAASRIARVVHGPEAFTPDGEFILGETAVRRPLGGRRLLRARPGRGRRRRQGDGRVDRRRRARVRRRRTWTSGGSAPTRPAAMGDGEGARRLLPLLRHRLPGSGVERGPTAAPLGDVATTVRTGRRARREGRLGAGQLVRGQRAPAATRRCARTAGPGRSGRRPSRPRSGRPPTAAGLFDQSSFAKLDVRGAARGVVPAAGVRQRRRPTRRHAWSTPSCSTSGPASRPT